MLTSPYPTVAEVTQQCPAISRVQKPDNQANAGRDESRIRSSILKLTAGVAPRQPWLRQHEQPRTNYLGGPEAGRKEEPELPEIEPPGWRDVPSIIAFRRGLAALRRLTAPSQPYLVHDAVEVLLEVIDEIGDEMAADAEYDKDADQDVDGREGA